MPGRANLTGAYNYDMVEWIMIALAFLCGSLPFSVWLGKVFLKRDVRAFGDGNPGSANVYKAGSKGLALLVLLLDVTKAAVPVGLSYVNLGIRGAPMVLIAVAPLVGHAFSPFLRFRGGKALAVALGMWIGLTLWKASLPAVLGVGLGMLLFTSVGWAVMVAQVFILAALLLWMPSPIFLAAWALQAMLLAWTHRADLRHAPRLRRWTNSKGVHSRGRAA